MNSRILPLFILFMALFASLQASDALLGNWQTQREFDRGGEKHRESEQIRFLPGTFRFILNADIQKGNFRVKGLKLEATGIWKREGRLLVLVMQQIRYVGVEESHGINPDSYKKLIRKLRESYLNDPILIYRIRSMENGILNIENSKAGLKSYQRVSS